MFACTVSIPVWSVALMVMLNCVPCVSFGGVMVGVCTCGVSWSVMVNVVWMVLLMLLFVSFASMVRV